MTAANLDALKRWEQECKRCHQRVLWALMRDLKGVTVDAEPISTGKCHLSEDADGCLVVVLTPLTDAPRYQRHRCEA